MHWEKALFALQGHLLVPREMGLDRTSFRRFMGRSNYDFKGACVCVVWEYRFLVFAFRKEKFYGNYYLGDVISSLNDCCEPWEATLLQ